MVLDREQKACLSHLKELRSMLERHKERKRGEKESEKQRYDCCISIDEKHYSESSESLEDSETVRQCSRTIPLSHGQYS